MSTCKKAAGGGNPPATTTRQSLFYTLKHTASTQSQRTAWCDRAVIVLAGLLVNLQEAVHLERAEREAAWSLLQELLTRYVVAKREGLHQ